MKKFILLMGLVSSSVFAVDVATLISSIESDRNVRCSKLKETKLGLQINLVRYHTEKWGCIGAVESYMLDLKVKRSITFTDNGKTIIEEVTNIKFQE